MVPRASGRVSSPTLGRGRYPPVEFASNRHLLELSKMRSWCAGEIRPRIGHTDFDEPEERARRCISGPCAPAPCGYGLLHHVSRSHDDLAFLRRELMHCSADCRGLL